jgi:hypothetical protein
MESGLRIYNVDPLVEKAHFGKSTILLLDLNFWMLSVTIEFVFTGKE